MRALDRLLFRFGLRKSFYYVRDGHWTAEGHRFAAAVLTERIWTLMSARAAAPEIARH